MICREILVSEIDEYGPKYESMNDDKKLEAAKAIFVFLYSDRTRFIQIKKKFKENMDLGQDIYLVTLEEFCHLLLNEQN